jgi:ankyrin repeat protein
MSGDPLAREFARALEATHAVGSSDEDIAKADIIATAIRAGDLPTVQRLIKDDDHFLNWRDDRTGGSPLHVAALMGRRDIAEFLVAQGADITKDCNGETPRQVAERAGKLDLLEILK